MNAAGLKKTTKRFCLSALCMTIVAGASAQQSTGKQNPVKGSANPAKGSIIKSVTIDAPYSDGRPTAHYRLDAKDQGIVLKYGDGPDSCDYLGARDIWVFENKGSYYMHYDGSGPEGWLACLATSKDGVHWSKKGPVLDYGVPGSPDSRSASYGTTYFDGVKWHMFYLGTPKVSGAPDYIPSFPYLTKKAESSSPAGPWKKRYDIIPFETRPGSYYAGAASPGYILKTGDEYRMLFSASTAEDPIKRGLGYARTRNLDSAWTPDEKPAIPLAEQVENTSIYYERSNKTWFVFTDHIGIQNGFEYTDAIWVYWTKDLDHWDPAHKAVVLDSTNCSWSKHIIGLPSVMKIGHRLAIFYDGHEAALMPMGAASHVRRDVGLAWLELPLVPPPGVSLPGAGAAGSGRPGGSANAAGGRAGVSANGGAAGGAGVAIDSIRSGFLKPPASARPGVYWYFMDGNRSKESMTADLESMKKAGIGSLIFLEVNVGVPRGPVDFLSDKWQELFAHAVREGERLGIEIILGTGPGWAGSGGPWVAPAQSMQHLVSTTTLVSGVKKDRVNLSEGKTVLPEKTIMLPVPQKIVLPVPEPRRPYFGEGTLTPVLKKQWDEFYEDVAVLAFPTPGVDKKIEDVDEKALYYRAPYSSTPGVAAFLPAPAAYPDLPAASLIAKSQVLDLTGKMLPDGTLNWEPPPGNWTIMRFGKRNNGAVTRPAPFPGLGFEADKFDTTAINAHLDAYVGKLLRRIGQLDTGSIGGLKRLHIDSWEMGAQNWTAHFREEFIKRRGYDPLPFYPVYAGNIVESQEVSERFLWDLRQTCQELILDYHAGQVKKYSHRHGLLLSIEPYDMNPAADLELGAVADIPMCEFWSKGFGFNTSFSCIEATSIAHVSGEPLVPSEAFTAEEKEGWQQYPGSMKEQGDWAFAAGINRFMYHTFQNQALDDTLRPGMTMGPYGVHWDRGQTWWPMVGDYHRYISRCQFVLQQGRAVADILYLTPEGAPQVFRPPFSALAEDPDSVLPDRRGYNFDGCSPGQLYSAAVADHRIVFPGGASYRLLVLPAVRTMTPALLEKIRSLIQDGAIVVGCPPVKSPGLAGYPQCDEKVRMMASAIWGGVEPPGIQSDHEYAVHAYGKGKVIWGGEINDDGLYPAYDLTAKLISDMGVPEDFESTGPIRYTHRVAADWDIYFVANRAGRELRADCIFRSDKGAPELWDPLSGKTRMLPDYSIQNGRTTIAMQFEAYQSFFVVFKRPGAGERREAIVGPGRGEGRGAGKTMGAGKNFPEKTRVGTLDGSWELSFDPKWGGPAAVEFDKLSDWTTRPEEGIRYYSGIAEYRKNFDLGGAGDSAKSGAAVSDRGVRGRIYLDLGEVRNMARVWLNGKDLGVVWTAPWQVDITDFVKQKGNQLKIEVANLWPNRLIGDEHLPDDGIKDSQWPEWLTQGKPRTSGRYTFTTFRHYTKDSPLLRSGLLGPVTIMETR